MSNGRKKQLKPQDVLILLKLISSKGSAKRNLDLAIELGISPAEICHGLERLKASKLIDPTKKKPMKRSLLEFLKYGLKYVFPAELGSLERGIPTAHAEESIAKKIMTSKGELSYVWPSQEGKIRGIGLMPLYDSVPEAVKNDPTLHKLLSLIDVLRVGNIREVKFAEHELEKEILNDA